MTRAHRLRGLAAAFILLGAAASGYIVRSPKGQPEGLMEHVPSVHNGGSEIVMVYVGSSRCAWANHPDLPSVVKAVQNRVRDNITRHARGYRFRTVGLSSDVRVEDGLSHLARFGDFDEVSVGGGSSNALMLRYIYYDIPGVAATPQLVITERNVERADESPRATNERLLLRIVGIDEARRWLANGVPLPLERHVVDQESKRQ